MSEPIHYWPDDEPPRREERPGENVNPITAERQINPMQLATDFKFDMDITQGDVAPKAPRDLTTLNQDQVSNSLDLANEDLT